MFYYREFDKSKKRRSADMRPAMIVSISNDAKPVNSLEPAPLPASTSSFAMADDIEDDDEAEIPDTSNIPISSISNSDQYDAYYEEYRVREIAKSMMFSYGDSEIPVEVCVDFILQLIHEQLTKLLKKARDLCNTRKHHPIFIKRLIGYMRIRETMPNLMQNFSEQQEDYNLELDQRNERYFRSKTLLNAVKEIDVYEEYADLFEPTSHLSDEVKMERLRRMNIRTQKMDRATYERFSVARTVSFCSKRGKKSITNARSFLGWLDAPKTEPGIAYILNYCATEILAIMVDNAVLCREQEAANPTWPNDHPAQSLQLRHYREALRRNTGYAERGDVLFGYF